jgi:hypothetical protein
VHTDRRERDERVGEEGGSIEWRVLLFLHSGRGRRGGVGSSSSSGSSSSCTVFVLLGFGVPVSEERSKGGQGRKERRRSATMIASEPTADRRAAERTSIHKRCTTSLDLAVPSSTQASLSSRMSRTRGSHPPLRSSSPSSPS